MKVQSSKFAKGLMLVTKPEGYEFGPLWGHR